MLKRKLIRTYLYKECPRCGGDLVLDKNGLADATARVFEYECLQCGRPTLVDSHRVIGLRTDVRRAA